jgi:hypothetical protein
MMTKKLAVPEILRIAKLPWGTPQVNRNAIADIFIHYRGPSWPGRILQPRKTVFFKSAHPVLDSSRSVTKKLGNLGTAKPGANQQDTVKSVVIARFFGSCDFLLDGNSHDLGILNLEFAHIVPPFL